MSKIYASLLCLFVSLPLASAADNQKSLIAKCSEVLTGVFDKLPWSDANTLALALKIQIVDRQTGKVLAEAPDFEPLGQGQTLQSLVPLKIATNSGVTLINLKVEMMAGRASRREVDVKIKLSGFDSAIQSETFLGSIRITGEVPMTFSPAEPPNIKLVAKATWQRITDF